MGPYFTFGQCGSCIFSQFRYALSRQSSIHSGSSFLPEMRRITSSFKPAGTTSDSMSVTKPYLYGCWTCASILVMQLPEVVTGHNLGNQTDSQNRNPNGFVGIVNELPCVVHGAWCAGNASATSHVPRTTHHAARTCLVNVSIPLPYEPLVVIRRVDLIDDRWIVHVHADDLPLVRLQNGPRPLPGRGRILEQLLE